MRDCRRLHTTPLPARRAAQIKGARVGGAGAGLVLISGLLRDALVERLAIHRRDAE